MQSLKARGILSEFGNQRYIGEISVEGSYSQRLCRNRCGKALPFRNTKKRTAARLSLAAKKGWVTGR